MGKNKKGGSLSHHSDDKQKRELSPPSEDFDDSKYSEEEFSSESEGSPVYASPSVSSEGSYLVLPAFTWRKRLSYGRYCQRF
jgi:hypothetical protein